MTQTTTQERRIAPELYGQRLDKAVAMLFPEYSRGRLQAWIKSGALRVNGGLGVCKQKVQGGEQITLQVDADTEAQAFEPEAMALDVLFEDQDLIVLNKPAGLVVHPAAGNWSGTLLNGLLHAYPELTQLPRAGLVHRLDKDTSGVMIVARSLIAHAKLVADLQARTISREYLALVQGECVSGGRIEAPIARHPVERKRMAVVAGGKAAATHYRVHQRYRGYTLLDVSLETGRTHQIRVHMAHYHHPLVGDPVYGGRFKCPSGLDEQLLTQIRSFPRQALHARRLTLQHPVRQMPLQYSAPIPSDLAALLHALEPVKL